MSDRFLAFANIVLLVVLVASVIYYGSLIIALLRQLR
jgi:hypothetical protein